MTLNNLKDVFENPDQLPFFTPILFNTMGFYVGYVRVPADFLVKLDVATEHSLVNFSLKGVDYLDEAFNGYTDNEITFGNVAKDGSVIFGIDDNHIVAKYYEGMEHDTEALADFLKSIYENHELLEED